MQVTELQTEVTLARQEHKSREQELRLKDQHIDNLEKQARRAAPLLLVTGAAQAREGPVRLHRRLARPCP